MLKEGHLAGETRGFWNPLLWGTFKCGGEIPTQASALRGGSGVRWPLPASGPLLLYFPHRPLLGSHPLNGTWGRLGL